MSKQPTPPAASTSAPPHSSASIAPMPLFLNLFPWKPPHSSQTGDSNLVANKTIDSSRKEKVPLQHGLDIGSPTSNLVVEVQDHKVACSFTRAGGFVWKYSPLSACFDNTEDTVIPCTGTLNDRPPSLWPLPVDGSGQPLLSPESTSLPSVQALIDEDGKEAVLAGQNMGSPAVMACFILRFPLIFIRFPF